MTAYATSQSTGTNYALSGNFSWTPSSFSIALWVRFSATSGSQRYPFYRGRVGTGDRIFGIYLDASQNVNAIISLNGTSWITATNSTTTLSVDTWYLIIVAWDGTDMYVYVGDEGGTAFTSGTVAASGTLHDYSSVGFLMGAANQYTFSSPFENGLIDSVAIWENKVLSSAERSYVYGALGSAGDGVNQDYLQNDTGDPNNPGDATHYWTCDEDGGPYVDSGTGTGRDLTVTGTITRVAGHIDEAILFTGGGGPNGFYNPFGPGPYG